MSNNSDTRIQGSILTKPGCLIWICTTKYSKAICMVDFHTRTRPGVTLLMLETFEVYATSCLVVLSIPKN